MSLAVSDENGSISVDKYAVGSCHRTDEGIAIRPVASFTCAGDEFHPACFLVNHPDRVTLGVGQIDISVRADADPLWAGKGGFSSWAAVAGETLLTGSRDMIDPSCSHIELVDGVSFAKCQPHVAHLCRNRWRVGH